jgi:predicted alpha-1,6-mannanase (GH76 family)
MIIAAAYLAKGLQDDGYRVKAESLYAWERRTLVDANTGKVYDNINASGQRSSYSSTYNQGTWIGSGVLLGHLDDARRCADWTKANLCNSEGVFRESGQGDVGGFKLIGARYIMMLSRLPGQQAYATWMQANADKVWKNRRPDGIMGYDWNAPAPASGIQAQCAAGGVSLLNLLATTGTPIRPREDPARAPRASAKVLSIAAWNGAGTAWLFRSPDAPSPIEGGRTGILRRADGRAAFPAMAALPK